MDWSSEGGDWPNAAQSRFITTKPHRWHVQETGQGDTILLLHGAGGATQSWRHLLPLLSQHFHVVAPDLPGQGFTKLGARMRCGLPTMAEDIARLCDDNGWTPKVIVGHSAGAAIALELTRHIQPDKIVGINAALGNFEGMAGWLFPLVAKFMAINPIVPPLLAKIAGGPSRVSDLLASTGSEIGAEGEALYRRLMTDRAHIDGTLAMMSQWRIEPLLEHLPQISTPTLLIVGTDDGTVPPSVSRNAARILPNAVLSEIAGRGHLVHEEVADLVLAMILDFIGPTSGTSTKPD